MIRPVSQRKCPWPGSEGPPLVSALRTTLVGGGVWPLIRHPAGINGPENGVTLPTTFKCSGGLTGVAQVMLTAVFSIMPRLISGPPNELLIKCHYSVLTSPRAPRPLCGRAEPPYAGNTCCPNCWTLIPASFSIITLQLGQSERISCKEHFLLIYALIRAKTL